LHESLDGTKRRKAAAAAGLGFRPGLSYTSIMNRVTKLPQIATVAAVLLVPDTAPGQTSTFAAPGRVESAGGPMAIGSAATGTVKEVLVHEWSRVRAREPLVILDCQPIEAEVKARAAQLSAAEAVFDRVRNGPRPGEIAVAEAAVGFSKARAEEAQKAFERTQSLREGVNVTTARVLEAQRDARISAALLAQAEATLALLREGSREEDVREAQARKNSAAAELENARARLEQCSVRAPVDGVVADVLVNPGQFLSLAVPATLLHIVADGALRVRVEVDPRDVARVCARQSATVTAEAFPNLSMRTQVEAISPVLSPRTLATPGAERGKDVDAIILSLERNGPALPIGLPVTAHFGPCPPGQHR
jgi:multidrug resistance efflux pump